MMRRNKALRRVLWLLGALGALAVSVWVLLPAPVAVDAVVVSRGRLVAGVSAEGKTRVRQLYEVPAPVDGTLERISLQPGDDVTPDGVVARIAPIASRPLDPRAQAEAVAALAAARAAVTRADATAQEAKAALEHADSKLATSRSLADSGALPTQDAVHAGHEAEIRRRAVDEARAAASEARAELARASAVAGVAKGGGGAALDVKPPAVGRVLRILHESGGPVAAGTPLLEIGDVTRLEIVADLLSSDAAEVELGASATISGWGGADLRARVRRIDPAAFTKISALGLEEQRVHVILDLVDPPPQNLGHDYRVDVRVATWEGRDVLRVPSTALFRHGQRWAVYVVRGGRASLASVEVGPNDGKWTAIERGLSAGEIVVTQPSDEVRDGVRVRGHVVGKP